MPRTHLDLLVLFVHLFSFSREEVFVCMGFPHNFLQWQKVEKESVLCMPRSICILKAKALGKIMKMQRVFSSTFTYS